MTHERAGSSGKVRAVICGIAVALVLMLWLPATHAQSALGEDRAAGQAAAATPRPGDADRSATTLWGSSNYREKGESAAEAMTRRVRLYGEPDAMRVFHTGLPASWEKLNSTYGDTSLVVSFKAPPREVVAGKHDATLRRWFADAPTDRVTIWTYWHEPEDDTTKGTFTASDYRAAFRHLARLADQSGNPQLRSSTILMCWSLKEQSGRTWTDWYPGNDVIDIIGWDCYQPARSGTYSDPEHIFGAAVAAAGRFGKPFGIGEWGAVRTTGDMQQRAKWIRDVSAYLADAGAVYALYYDAIGPEGGDYRLLDEHAKTAWRAVLSAAAPSPSPSPSQCSGWERVYRHDFTDWRDVTVFQSSPRSNDELRSEDTENHALQRPSLASNVELVRDDDADDGHALTVGTHRRTYLTSAGPSTGWTNGRMMIRQNHTPPIRVSARLRMTASVGAKSAVMWWPAGGGWPWEVDFAETFGGKTVGDYWGSRQAVAQRWHADLDGDGRATEQLQHDDRIDATRFHTYTLTITPERMSVAIDGRETFSTTDRRYIPTGEGFFSVGKALTGGRELPGRTDDQVVLDWVELSRPAGDSCAAKP